jgi:hypothetical protein
MSKEHKKPTPLGADWPNRYEEFYELSEAAFIAVFEETLQPNIRERYRVSSIARGDGKWVVKLTRKAETL